MAGDVYISEFDRKIAESDAELSFLPSEAPTCQGCGCNQDICDCDD